MNKSFGFENDVLFKMVLYYLIYVRVYNNSCSANMVVEFKNVQDIEIFIKGRLRFGE
jgi:hypothetical protein